MYAHIENQTTFLENPRNSTLRRGVGRGICIRSGEWSGDEEGGEKE